jgi:hydroxyacylglutathione hydrolase
MDIIPLPAFRDNYIWALSDGRHALVVDPGDAAPVEEFLAGSGLQLAAILVTHHHADHVGGIERLLRLGAVPVFGPARETIPCLSVALREGDVVRLDAPQLELRVMEVPGHTAGHIAYVGAGVVFCGDTLFSAGCGRLFEGTPQQMYASLARLAALPDDTRVYCTHEYTLANLAFACMAEPENLARDAWLADCESTRAAGRPTLPSSVGLEKQINPFLRTAEHTVRDTIAARLGHQPSGPVETFAALREWKNLA